jgi:hypothetical protein
VSGQLHALATLSPWDKASQYPLAMRLGGQHSRSGRCGEKCCFCRDSNPGRPAWWMHKHLCCSTCVCGFVDLHHFAAVGHTATLILYKYIKTHWLHSLFQFVMQTVVHRLHKGLPLHPVLNYVVQFVLHRYMLYILILFPCLCFGLPDGVFQHWCCISSRTQTSWSVVSSEIQRHVVHWSQPTFR